MVTILISMRIKPERRINENRKPALSQLRRKTRTAQNMTISGSKLQGLWQKMFAG
jgi:hypothetical protein